MVWIGCFVVLYAHLSVQYLYTKRDFEWAARWNICGKHTDDYDTKMGDDSRHIPVLLNTVLEVLAPKRGETVLDVTLGLGGHASAFAKVIGEQGRLIAFDADEENLRVAREHLKNVPVKVELFHTNFRDGLLRTLPPIDILFADLGLSSPHIDDPERGFSFRHDGPLDLRFDRSQGESVAQWIARASCEEVAAALWKYGEVRSSRRLAAAIKEEEPKTTGELCQCVEAMFGFHARALLPQVFQAFRIAINDELGALEVLLAKGPELLSPHGRMGIISYHSLEDRMVKQKFRSLATPPKDPLTGAPMRPAMFELVTKRPLVPSPQECESNPRSRSAKFRGIRRTVSVSVS